MAKGEVLLNGALVATVELLNGIEMTWVQFPYAPPISNGAIVQW